MMRIQVNMFSLLELCASYVRRICAMYDVLNVNSIEDTPPRANHAHVCFLFVGSRDGYMSAQTVISPST